MKRLVRIYFLNLKKNINFLMMIYIVILISFKAGSTGLNLNACSRVILADMWYVKFYL